MAFKGWISFPLRYVQQNLTASNLYALTVFFMVFGHLVSYFFTSAPLWLRIPDRALLPVFLISVGFNSAMKPSKTLWAGAIATFLVGLFFLGALRLFVPVTILVIIFVLEPLMNFLVVSSFLFWSFSVMLLVLSYHSIFFIEIGTMALIFAMAGWISVNRSVVPESVVRPWEFYVFTYFSYIIYVRYELPFNLLESFTFSVVLAFVIWLMLDFKILLLNSIKRRPQSALGHFCHYIGHKSLAIYVLQQVLVLVLYSYWVNYN